MSSSRIVSPAVPLMDSKTPTRMPHWPCARPSPRGAGVLLLLHDPECPVWPAVLTGVVEPAVFDERVLRLGGVDGGDGLLDLAAVGGMDGDADGPPCTALLLGDVADGDLHLLLDLFDLPPGVLQLPGQPLFQGAEFGEPLDGRKIGHVFESMGGGPAQHPGGTPDRYHLTLSSAGRPAMHGWWADRAVADRKLLEWIGEYGSMPDARITLIDEDTGETLTDWPGIVGGDS